MPQSTCSFDPCDNIVYAKELCNAHYIQRRKGKELRPVMATYRRLPEADRFRARVQKSDGCWLWQGAGINGYGGFSLGNEKSVLAHRYAWELANGPIPEGYHIDHICFTRRCVRPDHLRLATQKQNNEYKRGPQKNNRSGVRNVHWHEQRKKWVVYVAGQYLGLYVDKGEAEAVATAKRAELFTFPDYQ